ncbi:unnamed protein product, partial [Medioppia subpectinata]
MVIYRVIIALFITTSLIGQHMCGVCPSVDTIKPCKCVTKAGNKTHIVCGGNTALDLKNVFERFSKELQTNGSADDKHFDLFDLKHNKITELADNTFADISFNAIHIEAKALTTVRRNAFAGQRGVRRLTITETPVTDSQLFPSIGAMIGLTHLQIIATELTQIPGNCFDLLTDLREIKLNENTGLKRINSRAFVGLPSVDTIHLDLNNIRHIDDQAFLAHLNEKVYGNFLRYNPFNSIGLATIDCTDCRNAWL